MDKDKALSTLKGLVLADIRYLCRRVDRLWNAPIAHTLRDLRDCVLGVFGFGGAVRSLLFSRLLRGSLGRPRDVDIVVNEITIEGLRSRFGNFVSRETRFGGLQLLRESWQFDIWPLQRTWAFVSDKVDHPSFDDLPRTTFFNLEAIAVEVWPTPGLSRVIFSGDDQFFDGIINRTLEINREENPFPALCVTRALTLASGMNLAIGPNLASYLLRHSSLVTDDELGLVQLKHYGAIRVAPETARTWLAHIRACYELSQQKRIQLPNKKQKTFWPNEEDNWPMLTKLMTSRVLNANEECEILNDTTK